MKIATYNVNSLRKRLPVVLAWLAEHQPDVLALQETKLQDSEFPVEALKAAGYYASYRGMKGYNGVATLTRTKPERVFYGFTEGQDDEAVRLLHTRVQGIEVVNTYVPQGSQITSEKYQFKLQWFGRLHKYFQDNFDPSQPVIWLGDVNVAPETNDVYHPDRRVKDVDFHIDAREAYKQVLTWGLTDVFRKLHPDRTQYTYWDYFRNAFENNWGWRIDHILATKTLADRCVAAEVDLKPRQEAAASDHTVVWADFTHAD